MKSRSVVILSIFAFLLAGCAHMPPTHKAGDHCRRVVYLPKVALMVEPLERIESVEVKVTCGRIVAINCVPCDWSAELTPPVSEVTTLRMEAGHGSTSLCSSSALDGFLTVLVCEPSCFSITVSLAVFGGESERTITLKQTDLSLLCPPE